MVSLGISHDVLFVESFHVVLHTALHPLTKQHKHENVSYLASKTSCHFIWVIGLQKNVFSHMVQGPCQTFRSINRFETWPRIKRCSYTSKGRVLKATIGPGLLSYIKAYCSIYTCILYLCNLQFFCWWHNCQITISLVSMHFFISNGFKCR